LQINGHTEVVVPARTGNLAENSGMDARLGRGLAVVALVLVSLGASYRTPNFVVTAPTQQIAEQVGQQAEKYRRELAIEWLGKTMPNWARPCPVTVQIGAHLGAGGVTSFVFDRGEVFGWQMNIQGPLDRALDSVLPHEVTHTIFASHFRRPLPRWADEGGCTTVEHESERYKQQKMLIQFLQTGRGIPFSQMFVMKEYPRDILPLYAQGHSLSSMLIAKGGKQKFLAYVGEGLDTEDWVTTTKKFYGFDSLGDLQETWLAWVRRGSPPLANESDVLLVSNEATEQRPRVLRGQSPDTNRGEPTVIAPLVAIQRPGRAPVQLANGSPQSNAWHPAGAARAAVTPQPGNIAGGLPGPSAPPVTRQVATPPVSNDPRQPSVYAAQPRAGDKLLR
jgi:hypothetical protein